MASPPPVLLKRVTPYFDAVVHTDATPPEHTWKVLVVPNASFDATFGLAARLALLKAAQLGTQERLRAATEGAVAYMSVILLPAPRVLSLEMPAEEERIHIDLFYNFLSRATNSKGAVIAGVPDSVLRGIGSAALCAFMRYLKRHLSLDGATTVGLDADGEFSSDFGAWNRDRAPLARYYHRKFGFTSLLTSVDLLGSDGVYDEAIPMLASVNTIISTCSPKAKSPKKRSPKKSPRKRNARRKRSPHKTRSPK